MLLNIEMHKKKTCTETLYKRKANEALNMLMKYFLLNLKAVTMATEQAGLLFHF